SHETARKDLARRYLHVLGPGTPEGFARWAGVALRDAVATYDDIGGERIPVRTPTREAWLLGADEEALRGPPADGPSARLLPAGDPYLLVEDRELLVPDGRGRRAIWPPSDVPPGGVLMHGELVGTWRRAQG